MRILVVDDSRAIRAFIRNALVGMGHPSEDIHEAGDGAEALDVLAKTNVDLVLVDWNMPRMNGLAFLRETRASEDLKHLPVVMVTSESERSQVVEAIRAGARGYIVKPFTPETLKQKIATIEEEAAAGAKPRRKYTTDLRIGKALGKSAPPLQLEQLPEELLAGILEGAVRAEHFEGDVLVRPGKNVESLCFVERGSVELFAEDGTSTVLDAGAFFAEQAFLAGEPADVTVTVRTEVVVGYFARDNFDNLMAEFPHLSLYLTRFLIERARKTMPAPPPRTGGGLSGSLSLIPLSELVQTLHGSHKTGGLRLNSGEVEGSIYFDKGQVTHAETDEEEGEEGFYQMLSWPEGDFYFDADAPPPEQRIFRSTMSLLMEGMRQCDESVRSD
jgi:two-component system chemotaxis response regulator CheY